MDNKVLLKITFSFSIIGILILLTLGNIPIRQIEINKINNTILNKQVKIIGNLTSIQKISEDFYILNIKDSTGTIQVTSEIQVQENLTLEITGIVQNYKNKTQVKSEKINKI